MSPSNVPTIRSITLKTYNGVFWGRFGDKKNVSRKKTFFFFFSRGLGIFFGFIGGKTVGKLPGRGQREERRDTTHRERAPVPWNQLR